MFNQTNNPFAKKVANDSVYHTIQNEEGEGNMPRGNML